MVSPTSPGASIPTTIKDVARAAGTSVRSVSRVLNASPKVGADTRERIQRVIRSLNFEPNTRARALAAGRSFLIGLVQDDPNGHVIGTVQRSMAQVCAAHGFELVVHPARFDDPLIEDEVVAFVRRSRVDGLVLLPPLSELDGLGSALAALAIPVVALAAGKNPSFPTMLIGKEREASAMLADHLISLGHTCIGIITGPLRFLSARERLAGFVAAAAEAGVHVPQEHICEGDYGFGSGRAAAQRLLDLAPRPTAVFAANDIMAAAVVQAGRERAIDLPSELSIVGFDDSDIASMLSPPLTTVRRPLDRMATAATEELIGMVAGRRPGGRDQLIRCELMIRRSTAPLGFAEPPAMRRSAGSNRVTTPSRPNRSPAP